MDNIFHIENVNLDKKQWEICLICLKYSNLNELKIRNTNLDNLGEINFSNLNLTNLKLIDLSDSRFSKEKYLLKMITTLSVNFKTICKLILHNCKFRKDTKYYINKLTKDNQNLEELNIGGNFFENEEIKSILNNLHNCNNLKIFKMDNCKLLGHENDEFLFQFTKNCNFLTKLDLSNNIIWSRSKHLSLEKLLNPLTNLEDLSLENCELNFYPNLSKIDDKFLSNLVSLKKLNLSGNILGNFANRILSFIKYPEKLVELHLNNCFLENLHSKNLLNMSEKMINLKFLDLSNNLLKLVSIELFIKKLLKLQTLILKNNLLRINVNSDASSIKLFKNNPKLSHLVLDENPIDFKAIYNPLSIRFLSLKTCGTGQRILETDSSSLIAFKNLVGIDMTELYTNEIFNSLYKFHINSLIYISFRNCNLKEEDTNSLINFLSNQNTLQYLDLSENNFTYENIKNILQKLSSRNLLYLNLNGCLKSKITNTSISPLCRLHNLSSLNLSNNDLGNEIVSDILKDFTEMDHQLISLILKNVSIDSKILIYINAFMNIQENLMELNLSGNYFNISLGELLNNIKNNKNKLQKLYLSNCYLNTDNDEDYNHIDDFLRQTKDLTTIDLSNNRIMSNGSSFNVLREGLMSVSGLQSINLSDCDIEKNSNIYELVEQQNLSLESIFFDNNKFFDQSFDVILQPMCNCYRMKNLSLNKCFINMEKCSYLENFLYKHESLETLNLNNNHLYDKNGKLFDRISNFGKTKFKKIYLKSCSLNGKNVKNLQKIIESSKLLQYVNFEGNLFNKKSTILLKTIINKCKNISKINMENCNFLSFSGVHEKIGTENLIKLKSIKLFDKKINANILINFLRKIDKNSYYLSKIHLSFKNMEKLDNNNNETIDFITKHSREKIIISNLEIGNNHFATLFERFPKFSRLKKLKASNIGIKSGITTVIPSNILYLKHLKLYCNRLRSALIINLLKNLMDSNCELETIVISDCEADSDICKRLGDFISNQNKIKNLNISNNNLKSENILYVLNKVAKTCMNIRKFNLSLNPISFPENDFTLSEALRAQKYLKMLNLNEINLSNIWKSLLDAIKAKPIEILSLENCQLTNMDYELGSCIAELKYLRSLNLSFNDLNNKTVGYLLEILQKNCLKLENLYLEDCKINLQISRCFFQNLANLKRLQRINLSFNEIGDRVVEFFQHLEGKSSTFLEVYFDNCKISAKSAPQIDIFLNSQTFLEDVSLQDNSLRKTDLPDYYYLKI